LSEGEALFTKRSKTIDNDNSYTSTNYSRETRGNNNNNNDDIDNYSSYYNRRQLPQQQQQSPRSSKKSDYSGSSLLSENRREVLDFTSSRKRSEQEKELELERAKAKAGAGKDNGVSLHEVKPVPTTTAATINVVTMPSHQHESTVIQPLPEKQQHQPPAQEALEIEGIVIKI